MKLGRIGKFIANGLLLSATALALRGVGVWFSVYISGRLGAGGVGIYQLVMSVYSLAVTLACSGISTASALLVSQQAALKNGDLSGAAKRCVFYALGFGLAASGLLLVFAPLIGGAALGDELTIKPLRVLALSLPFLSMENALMGYFTAVRRVYKNAAAQLFEQAVKIGVCMALLTTVAPGDLEGCCTAIVGGGALSEFASFVMLALFYRGERRPPARAYPMKNVTQVALPVAFSAYARSALFTLKQLIVPWGLMAYGLSRPEALAQFGKIGGMVFPVILFPTALLYSFSGLLVPELTEFKTKGQSGKITASIDGVLGTVLSFSVAAAGLFALYGKRLGLELYGDAQTGFYIAVFSPLIISMYCDGAVDGLLKGLGEQKAVMVINLIDSALTLLAVWIALPRWGVSGYIAALFFSEMADDLMSTIWMIKVTRHIPPFWKLLRPPLLAALAAGAAALAADRLLPGGGLWLRITLTAAVYALVLLLYSLKKVEKPNRR